MQTEIWPNSGELSGPDGPCLPLTSPARKWVDLDSVGRGSLNSSCRHLDLKPQTLSCPKTLFSLMSNLTRVTGSSRKRLSHLIPTHSTMMLPVCTQVEEARATISPSLTKRKAHNQPPLTWYSSPKSTLLLETPLLSEERQSKTLLLPDQKVTFG